jgi:hypothetical protein
MNPVEYSLYFVTDVSDNGLIVGGGGFRNIHTYTFFYVDRFVSGTRIRAVRGLKFMIKTVGYCTVMGEPCVLECAGMLTCPFVSDGFLTQAK